jgi:hypothetical protein
MSLHIGCWKPLGPPTGYTVTLKHTLCLSSWKEGDADETWSNSKEEDDDCEVIGTAEQTPGRTQFQGSAHTQMRLNKVKMQRGTSRPPEGLLEL